MEEYVRHNGSTEGERGSGREMKRKCESGNQRQNGDRPANGNNRKIKSSSASHWCTSKKQSDARGGREEEKRKSTSDKRNERKAGGMGGWGVGTGFEWVEDKRRYR